MSVVTISLIFVIPAQDSVRECEKRTEPHHSIERWNPVTHVISVTSLDSNFRWNDDNRVCHCERSEAISSSFKYININRLLHFVRNDGIDLKHSPVVRNDGIDFRHYQTSSCMGMTQLTSARATG